MAANACVSPTGARGAGMPRRPLGKTGVDLPVIGFGGIVVMNATPEQAERVVADAFAAGVNYFDVAPTYGDAEVKLGPALKPYRDRSFLAGKTEKRDRAGVEQHIRQTLDRLQTDHLDLYQLHALTDVRKDVEAALGKGGAMEAIREARQRGQIRFVGFSAHSPEAALAAMREFDFDTVLYPVNFACHFGSGFEEPVLAEARRRGLGILCLKAMARRQWSDPAARQACPKCWYEPIQDRELARLALSWTLSQPVTAALPPGDERLFRLALELGPTCGPLSAAEVERLRQAAAEGRPVFARTV